MVIAKSLQVLDSSMVRWISHIKHKPHSLKESLLNQFMTKVMNPLRYEDDRLDGTTQDDVGEEIEYRVELKSNWPVSGHECFTGTIWH